MSFLHKKYKLTLSIWLLFPIFTNLFAQMKIPLTRNDSGIVQENEVLYQKFLKQGDKKEASRYLDNTAMLYWKHNYYGEAIQNFEKSLKLNQELQNYSGIAGINSNLAMIYADKGDHKNAYDYFEKTLAVRKAQKEKVGIISTLINESVVLNKLNEYDKSAIKLEEALSLAREMNDLKQMRSCYGMLAETYQKAGNMKKSMYYYNFFKTFNEHVSEKEIQKSKQGLKSEQLKKELAELEVKNKELLLSQKNIELTNKENIIGKISQEQSVLMDSLTKQELSLEVVKQKHEIANLENKQLTAEKSRNQLIISFVSLALAIAVGFSFWVYKLFRMRTELSESLKKRNRLISSKTKLLEHLNKEKNEIIYLVSHDLKAPLSQIHGLSNLMGSSGEMNEEQEMYSNMIQSIVNQSLAMITKTLEINRIENKVIDWEMINLSHLLEELIQNHAVSADKKNIKLKLKMQENIETKTDEKMLRHILDNLISNAMKFSPLGRDVLLELKTFNRKPQVIIQDQGPGFTEEDRKKLFTQYAKLSAQPTNNEDSSGLGLSIVKKLCDNLNINIELDENYINGARFILNL